MCITSLQRYINMKAVLQFGSRTVVKVGLIKQNKAYQMLFSQVFAVLDCVDYHKA